MSLYWYNYRTLEQLVDKSGYPGLETWCSIYKAFPIMLIDRTGPVRGPIKTSLDPHMRVPDMTEKAAKSFEECCMERALEIVRRSEELDKPIHFMFSGGIDSTAVAVSFLRACEVSRLQERLKIVTTTDAWMENPNFVREHLVGTFEFISARRYGRSLDGSALLVNGDPSDFGIFPVRDMPGPSSASLLDSMHDYLTRAGLSSAQADRWSEILHEGAARAPVEISDLIDMLWWVRFSWTRQYCIYHILGGVETTAAGLSGADTFHKRFYPFFDTPEFQARAMTANTDRSPRKTALRKFILDYTHDDAWVAEKGKVNSLPSIMHARKYTRAIDDSFAPLYTLDEILAYYDPANIFV